MPFLDPAYRIRDNQFWYNNCAFAELIRDRSRIEMAVQGLGRCALTHSRRGRDGRPTSSYRFDDPAQRAWWREHGGQWVRLELLSVDGTPPGAEPAAQPGRDGAPPPAAGAVCADDSLPGECRTPRVPPSPTLCIGLDIAWFGGGANDPQSRFDCLISVVPGQDAQAFRLQRIPLPGRDPEAKALLEQVDALLRKFPDHRVVLAVDAPLQTNDHDHLSPRQPLLQDGAVERRACENWLSACRQSIDAAAGGARGWHPNIQPGAPIPPRVQALLDGLAKAGFSPWRPESVDADRQIIECFPSEAIWAMKRLGQYRAGLTAPCVRQYKSRALRGLMLAPEQVRTIVDDVLHAFSRCTLPVWPSLQEAFVTALLELPGWRQPQGFPGGKILDDAVDSMICLATAISHASGAAHVWFDPEHPADGHIMGPGMPESPRAPWCASR